MCSLSLLMTHTMRPLLWLVLPVSTCAGTQSEDDPSQDAGQANEEAARSVDAAFEELASTLDDANAVIDTIPSSLPGVVWSAYFGERGIFITGTNEELGEIVAAFVMPIRFDAGETGESTTEPGFAPIALAATVDSGVFADPDAAQAILISDIEAHVTDQDSGNRRYQAAPVGECGQMVFGFWAASASVAAVGGATILCGAAALLLFPAAVPACALVALGGLGATAYAALRGMPCRSFLRCTGQCSGALGGAAGVTRLHECGGGVDQAALCLGIDVRSSASCGEGPCSTAGGSWNGSACVCPSGTTPVVHPCDPNRIVGCGSCSSNAGAGSTRRGQGYVVDQCQIPPEESECALEDLPNGSCHGNAYVCSGWDGAPISACEGGSSLCCPAGMCRYDYPAAGISHCVQIACPSGASNANTSCVCGCSPASASVYDRCQPNRLLSCSGS